MEVEKDTLLLVLKDDKNLLLERMFPQESRQENKRNGLLSLSFLREQKINLYASITIDLILFLTVRLLWQDH